jgi:Flp pilus assembly protein TadG
MRARLAGERGAVLAIVACCLPFMIGFVAIAVDLGVLRAAQQRSQAAVDAGALAGASDLPGSDATATTDATAYASSNGVPASGVGVSVSDANQTVSVTDSQTVPLMFKGFFGIFSQQVSASATAQAKSSASVVPNGNISPNGCSPQWWGGCEYSVGQYIPSTSDCSGTSSPTTWCTQSGTVDLQPCSGGGGSCTDPNGNPISNEVVDLNGSGEGAIYETVTTIPGQAYVISYDLTGNPNGNTCTYNTFTGYAGAYPTTAGFLQVPFTHTNQCANNVEIANFEVKSFSFTATSTQTDIGFASTTNSGSYIDYGPEVTNISFTVAQTALIK